MKRFFSDRLLHKLFNYMLLILVESVNSIKIQLFVLFNYLFYSRASTFLWQFIVDSFLMIDFSSDFSDAWESL